MQLVADMNEAPLSLHKVSTTGTALGKDIGQWHTPSVTAQSLQYTPHQVNNVTEMGLVGYWRWRRAWGWDR